MVQTPFTWRYGGRQVFLSGTFNGWSERVPLVLIEGSETIFQKTIDLLPGYYQYKFLVDGTWRVDQQQVCDTDQSGTINNIVLVSATGIISPGTQAEAVTPSVGTSSGNVTVQTLADGDMVFFRHVLSMYLRSSTAYELIPISGYCFALDIEVDVEQAFHVMHDLGLTAVPLWDENSRQMVGMLTASDFVLIMLQIQRNEDRFAYKELQTRTVSSWKSWKLRHHGNMIGTSTTFERRPLIHAGPDESLAGVVALILQNNISAIPIVHAVNGSSPRLLHIACLAGILRNVCNHFRHNLGSLSFLHQPVGHLPVGAWATQVRAFSRPLMTLHPDDTLHSALDFLLQAQVSSMPIVDDGGNFINMYSKSDITSLARNNIYNHVKLDQITVSQALELAGERGQTQHRTCTRFDSLCSVMELLSEADLRRVVVVEASSRRVEGIITLRDVFTLLCS